MRYRIPFVSLMAVLVFLSGAVGKEVAKMSTLTITSPVFKDNGNIPKQYTCDGKDVNPPLVIENIPRGAKSLALIVDDPDAPMGIWVHWVVWNMDPGTSQIKENSVPPGAIQGRNDFRKTSYGGPCPPSTPSSPSQGIRQNVISKKRCRGIYLPRPKLLVSIRGNLSLHGALGALKQLTLYTHPDNLD
jgi:hypothetical protein